MKRFINILLCISFVLSLTTACSSSQDDKSMKGVLLYTGYNGYSGGKYYQLTDDELVKLLDTTDEIVLIPYVVYNRYTDADGVEHEILSDDVINSMLPEDVPNAAYLAAIKSEYLGRSYIYKANYHINDYIEMANDYARRLVAIDPDVKLWYSVPQFSGYFHALSDRFAGEAVCVVDSVKNSIDESIWKNNVKGFYYAGEDIVADNYYTVFNPDNPKEYFDNKIVKVMAQASDKVHSYKKEMIWIPYAYISASSYENMAYVANMTDIFDKVIIQAGYFWNGDEKLTELETIKKSLEQQAVLDADGNIIGGKKTSDTVIGAEMEIDSSYFSNPQKAENYKSYTDAYDEFLDRYPIVYYADEPRTMVRLLDTIGEFFHPADAADAVFNAE